MHNNSILLFRSTDRQDIFPSLANAHFKSLSLISHKNKEQRRKQIGTKKDLFEGFAEYKSIRIIFLEDRKFSRSFNERASHTNKRDKSSKSNNNNNKVLA